MSAGQIILLVVLAVLLAVCFLSGKIAARFFGPDGQTVLKRSLQIKIGASAAASGRPRTPWSPSGRKRIPPVQPIPLRSSHESYRARAPLPRRKSGLS